MNKTTCLMLTLALAGLSGAVRPDTLRSQGMEEWVPIDPARLDDMRGGWVLPSGLALSFGIERVAYVNGVLVASTRVHIPDISNMTPDQANALQEARKALVVQVGPGNSFEGPGPAYGTVIQNTLNDQHLQTITTIEVGVGTLGLFQNLNSAAALQNALQAAGGAP